MDTVHNKWTMDYGQPTTKSMLWYVFIPINDTRFSSQVSSWSWSHLKGPETLIIRASVWGWLFNLHNSDHNVSKSSSAPDCYIVTWPDMVNVSFWPKRHFKAIHPPEGMERFTNMQEMMISLIIARYCATSIDASEMAFFVSLLVCTSCLAVADVVSAAGRCSDRGI